MYTYPANECSTDAIEQRQDRHKRVREAALIKTVAAFEWQIAIDFGCGIGRNLPHLCALVDPSTGARICAIDPDVDRLGKARADFGPLKNSYTDLEFVTGSYLELQGLFPKNSVDFILCCQVLTHMDRALFRNVMETFR
jgi:ubiquinone/menaquinone biosynthesis C-methylase UbiE